MSPTNRRLSEDHYIFLWICSYGAGRSQRKEYLPSSDVTFASLIDCSHSSRIHRSKVPFREMVWPCSDRIPGSTIPDVFGSGKPSTNMSYPLFFCPILPQASKASWFVAEVRTRGCDYCHEARDIWAASMPWYSHDSRRSYCEVSCSANTFPSLLILAVRDEEIQIQMTTPISNLFSYVRSRCLTYICKKNRKSKKLLLPLFQQRKLGTIGARSKNSHSLFPYHHLARKSSNPAWEMGR